MGVWTDDQGKSWEPSELSDSDLLGQLEAEAHECYQHSVDPRSKEAEDLMALARELVARVSP